MNGLLQFLCIVRGNPPFKGQYSLPGGFLRLGEDLPDAAVRELGEETGIDGRSLRLEQLGVYGAPDRDPRGRVASVAYVAIFPDLPIPTAGSDAAAANWKPVGKVLGSLAFDHDRILSDAVEHARSRLEFSTLATRFCGPEFTMGELRNVYEVVWGCQIDPRNFNRKVLHTVGFVEPTGYKRTPSVGRPAALYRPGDATGLNPALLRASSCQ